MSKITIRLLGLFQIDREGKHALNLHSRKGQALLGYLGCQDGPVSRSLLASLFWPDKSEPRGRRNLSRELSQIAAQLPHCIDGDYYNVQFSAGTEYSFDTWAFDALVQTGQSQPATMTAVPERAVPDQLVQAVALYRGDFMTGHYLDGCAEFETWLVREQERWRQRVIGVLGTLVAHYMSQGEDGQAEAYIRRWLTLEPWQEQAHRHLMILLARNGNRSAALAQYDLCFQALQIELGVEPSAETLALYEQIANDDVDEVPRSNGDIARSAISSAPASAPAATAAAATPSVQSDPYKIFTRLEPLPDQTLYGVETAQETVRAVIQSAERPWLIALDGIGGIGKTTLADRLVRELAGTTHFADIGWVSAKQEEFLADIGIQSTGRPALDVETLTDTLLDQLADNAHWGASVPEKQAALVRLLKERACLIVVDNLETVADYEALLPYLRQLANPSKFLITSRLSLQAHSDVYCYSLTELNEADTLTFLRHEAETRGIVRLANAAEAEFREIYAVVGGNPLALKLVMGQVRFLSLAQVLDNLVEAQGKRIDQLYTYIYWQAWQMLDDPSRQLFLTMPTVPNSTFAQLVAISELDADTMQSALSRLIALSLIQVGGELHEPRYRLHRLTETFLMNEVLKWQVFA